MSVIDPQATSENESRISTQSNATPTQRLALSTKLAYGAPSFAGAAMAIPIAIHLTIFYSDTILVPLGLIAIIKAGARVLDAITDPLMGWLSDRTRSRWGRRKPWMTIGAPLAAIAFFCMFTPPTTFHGINAAIWLAASYTLYYLFHTVYIIPHSALGPELTLDYNDRSGMFGIQQAFVVIGTMVAAVLPALLINLYGDQRAAYSGFALLFGALLAMLYFNLVWRVKERPDFVQRESNPLIPGVRRVMRNRAFRLLLAVYLAGSITAAIPGLMMPYYTKYVLQPENPNMWLALLLLTYFGSGFLCLPLWVKAAQRFERKSVWLFSFVPGITASLSLFTLGQGDMTAALVVLMIGGSSFGAGLFIAPSMQADVIDYDELYSGRRREAQYGALWSILTKFTVIPSMSVPLAILATVGYVPNITQTETVQFTIRAIFGLGPASTSIIAFCIACFYPISRVVHRKIWAGIEAHKRGENAIDPITGHLIPPAHQRGIDEATGWYLDHFSQRELRRAMIPNSGSMVLRTLAQALLSLMVCLVALYGLYLEFDPSHNAALLALTYVVLFGLAVTAVFYNLVRMHAAMKLKGIADFTISSHLEMTRQLNRGVNAN